MRLQTIRSCRRCRYTLPRTGRRYTIPPRPGACSCGAVPHRRVPPMRAVRPTWPVALRRLGCRALQIDFHAYELRERTRCHLFHDLRAMNLDGSLADTEIDRDDLVCLSIGNAIEHVVFARRQRFVARPE